MCDISQLCMPCSTLNFFQFPELSHPSIPLLYVPAVASAHSALPLSPPRERVLVSMKTFLVFPSLLLACVSLLVCSFLEAGTMALKISCSWLNL